MHLIPLSRNSTFESVLHFCRKFDTGAGPEIRQVIQMSHFCLVELTWIEFDTAEVRQVNRALAHRRVLSMGLTVKRQMAKKLTVNRQKCNIFNINRQTGKPILAVKCLRYP